jgi:hypothetical protein
MQSNKGIGRQNVEFDAMDRLAKEWRRLQLTAVVDDDYPEVRHDYEGACRDFLAACKANGRAIEGQPARLIVTLCGSTRFPDAFELAAAHLGMMGCIVLSVAMYGHADQPRGAKHLCLDGDEKAPEKQNLDRLHFDKIAISDAIFVVNVGGYIGSSTRREIDFARSLGKRVDYLFATGQPLRDPTAPAAQE